MKKIIILLLILLLTGCSYQELNDLTIISGLGFDYIDNTYIISAEVLDLTKSEDSSKIKSIFYEGKGDSLPKAIRDMMKSFPKTIYLGHLEAVIVGKTAIPKINELYDYLFSSPEASTECLLVAMPNNNVSDLYNVNEEYENNSPTENLVSSIKNTSKYQGSTNKKEFEQFYSDTLNEGIDPLVTTIEIAKTENSSTSIISASPIKDNIIYDSLNENEIISFNIIKNNIKDIIISDTYDNSPFSIYIFEDNSDISYQIDEEKIKFKIIVNLKGHVAELKYNINYMDETNRKKMEKIMENKIITNINSLLAYGRNNNTDILGLKQMIYRHDNNLYNNLKDKNLYEEEIETIVNIDIFRSGTVYKGSDLN